MSKGSTLKKMLGDLVIDSSPTINGKYKVLFVASEATPYASEAGLASVVGYLSRELASLGHDVRILIPKFGSLDVAKYDLKTIHKGLKVPTGDEANPYLECNIQYCDTSEGVPTYFLENQEYYEKRANIYGYSDDAPRWALLSRGALPFIGTKHFVPDVIHCNDWHTGLIPNLLKMDPTYSNDVTLSNIATVYTLHNLAYQFMFDHHNISELDFDDGKSPIASFFDERLNHQNFMRRGVLYSDIVNTVSKTYSKEILTPEFGEGLDKLFLELREKLFGIVNGLDYSEYNPETDDLIPHNYDKTSLELRSKNKTTLQKEYDLPVNPKIPVLGFVGRLTGQKGIDLMVETLRHVMKDFDVQFVQVGGGDGWYIDMLQDLQKTFPDKVGVHTFMNHTLPRLLFSGCDMLLYPSKFEPCGVVQLEAMRYGAIPVVRNVGGLADTVDNFDSKTGEGTGLVFSDYNEFSLFGQIVRGIELHNNSKLWKKLQTNAMSADFSWKFSAKEYSKLYKTAISFKNKKSFGSRIYP